jgi:transcriptional regulator with XRE-family HTH domain
LRLSQNDVAQAAGVTERTYRQVEKAEAGDRTPTTLRGIAEALGWTPASIDLVVDGGEPQVATVTGDGDLQRQVAELTARLEALEARFSAREGAPAEVAALAGQRRATRRPVSRLEG